MCVHVCLHTCLCTGIGSQVSPWVEGLQTGFQALNLSSQKKVLSLRPAMDFALKNQIDNVTWHKNMRRSTSQMAPSRGTRYSQSYQYVMLMIAEVAIKCFDVKVVVGNVVMLWEMAYKLNIYECLYFTSILYTTVHPAQRGFKSNALWLQFHDAGIHIPAPILNWCSVKSVHVYCEHLRCSVQRNDNCAMSHLFITCHHCCNGNVYSFCMCEVNCQCGLDAGC